MHSICPTFISIIDLKHQRILTLTSQNGATKILSGRFDLFNEYLEKGLIKSLSDLNIVSDELVDDRMIEISEDFVIEDQLVETIADYFSLPEKFSQFGEGRKKEYLLSRLLILNIHWESNDLDRLFIPENFYNGDSKIKRSGSVSHHKNYIRVAVSNLRAWIGIDSEHISRNSLEGGLWNKIATKEDKEIFKAQDCDNLKNRVLLFSAKEALYKFAYPFYKDFFGFQEASISQIDIKKGVLYLKSHVLGKIELGEIKVDYKFDNNLVHTLIQLPC